MKNKTFDCVEMKRRGAEKVREAIAGMTMEEELAWWKERTEELRKVQQAVRERRRLADGQAAEEVDTVSRGRG